MLNAITNDEEGRLATGATLGARIAERLADTRAAVAAYESLLSSPTSTETALQSFIQAHPWMVGLDYLAVRLKALLPRGQLDFCLERFDGYYDVLELKSPIEPIITVGATPNGLPPPPNAYKLGPTLANALARVHVYRDVMTSDAATVERLFGLTKSRNPRLIIIAGQLRDLTPECQRVLAQLNLSLQRVEIMPYDLLGRRAEGWIANIESYLGTTTDGDL